MISNNNFIDCVSALSDNWKKMAENSDDEIVKRYFNARHDADLDLLKVLDNECFDPKNVSAYLKDSFTEECKKNVLHFADFNSWDEVHSGKSNEYSLLCSVLDRDFQTKFGVEGEIIKTLYYDFFGKYMCDHIKTQE